MLLDQYGAADVIMPEVRLQRSYPGGPATGIFIARHGPDNRYLGQVTLRVANSAGIPRLLDEGIRRLDAIYAQALDSGLMRPDPSLNIELPPPVEELEEPEEEEGPSLPIDFGGQGPAAPAAERTSFTIRIDTPDEASVDRAELSVSRIGGVTSALTTDKSLGGTSTMKVTFMGDSERFRAALSAQGWSVSGSGTSLRISRGGGD
jgi:hypothetical protein